MHIMHTQYIDIYVFSDLANTNTEIIHPTPQLWFWSGFWMALGVILNATWVPSQFV